MALSENDQQLRPWNVVGNTVLVTLEVPSDKMGPDGQPLPTLARQRAWVTAFDEATEVLTVRLESGTDLQGVPRARWGVGTPCWRPTSWRQPMLPPMQS